MLTLLFRYFRYLSCVTTWDALIPPGRTPARRSCRRGGVVAEVEARPRSRPRDSAALTSGSALSSASKSAPCSQTFIALRWTSAIGVLAADARLGQRQQHALRMDQPAQLVRCSAASSRDRPAACRSRPVSRASAKSSVIVASGPIIRSTDEWRDVALVPQRDVLHRRHHRHAHQPREAGQVLGQHRVALVRHRRRALLARREIFLRLQHLGALQVADLDRQPLDRARRSRPSVAKNIACRSRGMTCVETGSTASPTPSRHAPRPPGRCWRRCRPRRRSRRSRSPPAPRPAARGSGRTRHRPAPASARRSSARHGCRGCGRWSRCPCARRRGASAPRAARRDRRSGCRWRAPAARPGRCRARPSWSCPGARSAPRRRRARPDGSGRRSRRAWSPPRSRRCARRRTRRRAPSRRASAAAFGITPELGQRVGGMRLDLEPDAKAGRRATRSRSSRGGNSAGSSEGLSRLTAAGASDRLRPRGATSEGSDAAVRPSRDAGRSTATIEDVLAGRPGRLTGVARFTPRRDGLAYRRGGDARPRRRRRRWRRRGGYLWRDGGRGSIEVLLRGRPLLPPLRRRGRRALGAARLRRPTSTGCATTSRTGRAGGRSGGCAGRARTTPWSAAIARRGARHERGALRCCCASRGVRRAPDAGGAAGADPDGLLQAMQACLADPRKPGCTAVDRARGFVVIKDDDPEKPKAWLIVPDREVDRHREPGGVPAAGRRLLALRLAGGRGAAAGEPAGGPGARDQLEGGAEPEPAPHPHLLRPAGGARRAGDGAAIGPRLGGAAVPARRRRRPTTCAGSPRSSRARSCGWRELPGAPPTWATSRSR